MSSAENVKIGIRGGEFPKQLGDEFYQATSDAIWRTGSFLNVHPIQLDLYPTDKPIPGFGHRGHTLSDQNIRIGISPDFPNREQLLQIEIPRTVSHEIHHAVRWHHLGHRYSLAEALVMEGLATHFEIQVWGGEPSAWAMALTDQQTDQYLKEAIKEIEHGDTSYNHSRWFYGSSDIPRWTGYSLGYFLVDKYLNLHPEETAVSLVTTPTSKILQEII